MRAPRLRFRVRHMLVAVAILAVIIWTTLIAMRSLEYGRRASEYARHAQELRGEIREQLESALRWQAIAAQTRQHWSRFLSEHKPEPAEWHLYEQAVAISKKQIEDHDTMARGMNCMHVEVAKNCDDDAVHYEKLATKYRRAAWRPWEFVPPDPVLPSDLKLPAFIRELEEDADGEQ